MNAFDYLAAAAYLLLIGCAIRWVCRRLPGGEPPPLPRRTPADVARSLDDFRAARLTERYPELDAQLDQYADRIRSLYAEGDR